jgi:hypothetical protein
MKEILESHKGPLTGEGHKGLLNNLDKLLGEVVGLGTVIFALGIGPSVALGITIVGKLSKQV